MSKNPSTLFDIALKKALLLGPIPAAQLSRKATEEFMIRIFYGENGRLLEDQTYLDKEIDFKFAALAIRAGFDLKQENLVEIAPYLLEKAASNATQDSLCVLRYFIEKVQNPEIFFEHLRINQIDEVEGIVDGNEDGNNKVSSLFVRLVQLSDQDFLPKEDDVAVVKNFLFENYYARAHQLNQEAAKTVMIDLLRANFQDAAYNLYKSSDEIASFYNDFMANNNEAAGDKILLDQFQDFVFQKTSWAFDELGGDASGASAAAISPPESNDELGGDVSDASAAAISPPKSKRSRTDGAI